MPKSISEFLGGLSTSTLAEYQTTIKYLKLWGYKTATFADWLNANTSLAPYTQPFQKHCEIIEKALNINGLSKDTLRIKVTPETFITWRTKAEECGMCPVVPPKSCTKNAMLQNITVEK